jgi:osmotically-inducible protein OsmY
MMKTLTQRRPGSQTQTAVRVRAAETLARSFDIDRLHLTKTAGALVVEGQVPSYRLKKLAGTEAARLFGAAHVVNRLRVVPQSHRQDSELVAAVLAALDACARAERRSVLVSTQDGIVILHGHVCCSDCRSLAEAAAWAVGGVVDVANRLRVTRSPAHHDPVRVPSFLRAARR